MFQKSRTHKKSRRFALYRVGMKTIDEAHGSGA
jgi:hypothetical protein